MERAAYVALAEDGTLAERARQLDAVLRDCTMCPHLCRVDRRVELGTCNSPADATVASWGPHPGEEPVISARRGSGTVFLGGCNLACAFCQNHEISQPGPRRSHRRMSAEALADVFLELQAAGCHNVNWVSPSHQVAQLVGALDVAATAGLEVPIVYNSNGYDSVETLRLLDGVVDVYMPDLKYADAAVGEALSAVPAYPHHARAALREMYRQVGDGWRIGPDGALRRGLLVRMLVLPGGLAGIDESLRWIAESLSDRIAISLLAQYHPAHRAARLEGYPDLARRLTADEWREALTALRSTMTGDRHHAQGEWLL